MKILFDGEGAALEQVLPVSFGRQLHQSLTNIVCAPQEAAPTLSLWYSKLFPVFPTRKESSEHAVGMLQRLRRKENPPQPS